MGKQMRVIQAGLIEYTKALEVQKDLVRGVQAGGEDVLLLCEHPATLTLGRATRPQNILAPREELVRRGVAVAEADRGGDVTLHAPGQLVAYPVMDLKRRGRDLGAYLRKLEQASVDFLADFGIVAQGDDSRRGVWAGRAKIASIGIGVSRWVTYHGVGVNVTTDLTLFRLIRPCGLDVAMTSVKELTGRAPAMADAAEGFVQHFSRIFHDEDRSS